MITFSGNGVSLVLPDPQLADKEIIDLRIIYRRMMSGLIRSYKIGDPITRYEIEIRNVNRPKILEVINFLVATKGMQVQYTDYNGVSRTGLITNLPNEFTHTGPRDNVFNLVFEVTV